VNANVAIIDGGGANIASLQFALERLGARSQLTTDVSTIKSSSHIILPGVGAAAAAMRKIRSHQLDDMIPKIEQPVLGICLGMQLLAAKSDEDGAVCLGIFSNTAAKLPASSGFPVPNMGWCRLAKRSDSELLSGISDGSWFYFVHSYALPVSNSTVGTATHASEFSAAVSRDNFHAVQFHPERSSAAGARLLKNFLEMR